MDRSWPTQVGSGPVPHHGPRPEPQPRRRPEPSVAARCRALNQQKAVERQNEISDVIDTVTRRCEELGQKYSRRPEYFEAKVNFGGRLAKRKRAPSAWNAFQHQEAKRRNTGGHALDGCPGALLKPEL
jgi:hypothetical protein